MLKGFVSGEEKDIVRIPMKGKNLWDLQSWTNTTNDTRSFFQLSITLYNGSTSFGERRFNVHETGRVSLTSATAGADGATRLGIKHNGSTRDLVIGNVYDDFPANQPLTISFDVSGYDPTIAGGISISNIMLNLGSTALPYEPYGYQEGWEVRDSQDRLIWGREDEFQTATGTLPFKGYALPVKVKSLLGNGSQTGTPTPDNPVMPTFCGVRTGNLFDKSTPTLYEHSTLGQVNTWAYSAESTGTTLRIPCDANTQYTLSIGSAIGNTIFRISEISTDEVPIEGGSGGIVCHTIISGDVINSYAFTTASDSKYILFQVNANVTTAAINTLMFNLGSTALPYEPFGWAEKITCAGQTVPVYLGQTQTVRRIRKLVFDGKENWIWRSGEPQNVYFIEFAGPIVVSNYGLCTHYPNQDSGGFSTLADKHVLNRLASNNSKSYIAIRDSYLSTLSDFKSYLAQQYANGTPVTIWYVLATEQTGIVNEPLCKIGNYADELSSTVATLPEIPTTTGENTLTVDTTLAPYEVIVEGHIKYGYWGKIREDVRSGVAQTKFPVGTILYDNGDETTGAAFQVVGYDKHFDPEMTARGYTHSMTLCELKLTDLVTFDATEALLYVETAIAPGTYRFKIPNYDATYGGNKSYYFTTTKSIPVGGQITINWPYQQTPKTASTYSEIAGVTAIESGLTLSEWVEGDSPAAIDLGTAAGPNAELGTSSFGKMNHIHRARYGSDNYLQSGIRQYINSDKAANSWWSPQTVFDRPYESRTSAGKLTKLSSEFVDVLVKPTIKSRTNNYFETDSLDGTKFSVSTDYTITTDKMFLPSPNEVGLNADTTIGSTLDYYLNATNADRIKYRASNGAAYYWWLRTPTPTNAHTVRIVNASGAWNDNRASNTNGVAAACVIQ